MKRVDAIRLFGMTNLSIEADIRRVEREHRVDLGHIRKKSSPATISMRSFPKNCAAKLK